MLLPNPEKVESDVAVSDVEKVQSPASASLSNSDAKVDSKNVSNDIEDDN